MKRGMLLLLVAVMMVTSAACGVTQSPVSPSGTAVPPSDPTMLPSGTAVPPSDSAVQSSDSKMQPADEGENTNIQMAVKEKSVAGDAETVTVTITNASDKEYTYGAATTIETQQDGAWNVVKPIGDLMWIEIAYIIAPGESNEQSITISGNYGTLEPGNYRAVKTFTDPEGSSITVYGPFIVK